MAYYIKIKYILYLREKSVIIEKFIYVIRLYKTKDKS